jgi:hypothetical protein
MSNVPPVPPSKGNAPGFSYMGQTELPPGKPLSLDNPWTKMFMKLFEGKADPALLARYAEGFMHNMQGMLVSAVSRARQKMHEEMQRMKRIIEGQE